MGGVEDSHWVDMIIDEIGAALSKVDESIQKTINLWTELTKDIFDDQPTQDLTGQPNNGESGEEFSSQEPPVQVELERTLQHWSMPIDEVKQKPSEHGAMRASKIPECLIQEPDGDGDSDSDSDSDSDNDEEDDDEEATSSEEDSGSSFKWNVDTSSEKNDESWDDDDDDEEDETIVTESSENTWEQNLEAWGTSYNSEEDNNLKWKGYRRLNNVVISSEEDNESCDDDDDDDDEEDETTVSESSEGMLELNLGASATSYIPSSHHHHNEEDNGSSLKWNGGYQLLKNVDKSSEEDNEDEVEECYLESVEQVLEVLRKHRMSDLSNESFVCLDDEDDLSDEGFFHECDWVYVTRD